MSVTACAVETQLVRESATSVVAGFEIKLHLRFRVAHKDAACAPTLLVAIEKDLYAWR